MAIPELIEDLAVIQKLGDNPNTDDNLTAQELKARFDKAPLAIQKYINEVLLPNIEVLRSGGVAIGSVAPAGPALWLNTTPQESATLQLTEDSEDYAVMAAVDDVEYGVENATVNQTPTSGTYDFTVL